MDFEEVGAGRSDTLKSAFSLRERREIEGAPLRTVAGFLALKRALRSLHREAGLGDRPEAAWELAHAPDGAPCLVNGSAMPEGPVVFVSIAHSGDRAWAMAAFQQADRKHGAEP